MGLVGLYNFNHFIHYLEYPSEDFFFLVVADCTFYFCAQRLPTPPKWLDVPQPFSPTVHSWPTNLLSSMLSPVPIQVGDYHADNKIFLQNETCLFFSWNGNCINIQLEQITTLKEIIFYLPQIHFSVICKVSNKYVKICTVKVLYIIFSNKKRVSGLRK